VQPFDSRTARVLATVLLFGLGLASVALAWKTLVTFLFAILFAYLFEPAVSGLEKRFHLRRAWAVGALYVLLLVGIGGFLTLLGPRIVQQATRLAGIAPGLSAKLASGQIVRQLGGQRGWSYETQLRIQSFVAAHQVQIARWEGELVVEIERLAGNLLWVGLVPIIAIFFLIGGGRFAQAFLDQLGRRPQRQFARGLLQDVHEVLAHYIRGQILLTAIALGVYLVGFELLRVPYAIGLGVVAGVLEFIPMVGPLLGAVLVLGTAFFLNYPYLLGLAVFLGVWRLEQDYVNSPHIMGGQVQLHPLAVLFGVLAGAEMAGLIGVYLSVPVMATLRVAWLRWRSYEDVVDTPEAGGRGPVITPP
jgi:predicted PurR-regulated permease PerM